MRIAADNINPMVPEVRDAIESMNSASIKRIAAHCVAAGAEFIDINPGRLPSRKLDRMRFLVETVQDCCDASLILDSSDIEALKIGLAALRSPGTISAATISHRNLDAMLEIAASSNSTLVALLTGDTGLPPASVEEKIEIALRMMNKADSAGVSAERLIFDPVIPHLSWPDWEAHLAACYSAIEMLSGGSVFGFPLMTMAGFSNLLSGYDKSAHSDLRSSLHEKLIISGLNICLKTV